MSTPRLRDRVAAIVAELPEATCTGDRHLTLAVRKKTFGYFLDDHQGDGIAGVAFKAAPGEQDPLVRTDPERFHVPAYLGARGWAAVRLDVGRPGWAEVGELLTDAYRLRAPRRLVAQLADRLQVLAGTTPDQPSAGGGVV
ncbi:MmcQ/YjbR family DNA-binding protein [Actinophytocola glycyrrhizae]|uniref:MmcQ/YjbR family DNA-binding protein n=1 Tax=Actinophytocola glycyrrhizae TaxID=2044873 RepID=A0ABV9S8A7_9PSEU